MAAICGDATVACGYSGRKDSFPHRALNVSYETMRRSSRVPKELAILLTGSDMEGKGFSEMTRTVLLSRHGAGIVSTYKLYAEQEVIIRYLESNREAVVRVVGRIGDEGEAYTYGVAFLDAKNVDFWGIDFAPVTDKEKAARRLTLECATCGRCETVEQVDVESDVFLINDGIVRYCKSCHDSTLWKRSTGTPEEEPALVAVGREARPSSFAGLASDDPQDLPEPRGTSSVGQSFASAPSAPATELTSAATSSQISEETITASSPDYASEAEPAAPEPIPAPPTAKPAGKTDNRRKHTRMRVNYKACIRRPGFTDEVVTCEDMSRGGICFKSRKRYFEKTEIEVAVPYAPGGNAIFVPAHIAWVVEVEKDKQYKCGVAYRITSRAS